MKRFISVMLAVLVMVCSVNISTFAETATTINVTSETVSGNMVTISGTVSTGEATPLEILVSKNGNKVAGGDITPNASGEFTYSFEAAESGIYDYVVSEKISGIAPTDVLAEDFSTAPTASNKGAWVSSNLAVEKNVEGFDADSSVLKVINGRYLYDVNGNGTSYGNPLNGTAYEVEADVKLVASSKPNDMLIFRTVNSNGSFAENTEHINQSGKAEAYQVRATGTDIVLIHAQNNKLQEKNSQKSSVLIENYVLNQKYNIKIEFDLDTLELKAYVDNNRVLADEEMYIFSQSPAGYRRLFEANNQNMNNTLYIGDLELNRYTKAYSTGSIGYYSANDIQAAVDYVKATDSSANFKAAITEKKEILGLDDTKAFYGDDTVLGSAYTDVKANVTDVESLKDILDKAEILYNLKVADKTGDLTAVEALVKDYGYSIVYKNCIPDTKTALNTAATAYGFSASQTVDANINGWISAMETAYAAAIANEGISTVTYDAVYSPSDNGIKITGSISPAAAVKLKAIASTTGEDLIVDPTEVEFTTKEDGSFECVIPVETETENDYTVNIEAVNAASTKTTIFSSEFDSAPVKNENNVITTDNLSIESGALKIGGASNKSRFIVSKSIGNNTGVVRAEAKIKKTDNDEVVKIFSLGTGDSSLPIALGADGNGNFILKYTSTTATSGHLNQSINLGAYDTTKWYSIGYELNLKNKVVTVFFEDEVVLTLKLATHHQTLQRFIDAEASTSQGVQYLDSFNCYYDNGLRINADSKSVTVPTSISELRIKSFDGTTAIIESPNATTGVLIFATYDGDELEEVELFKDFVVNQGTTEQSTTLSKSGATMIKVFLWNNMIDITPLCEHKYSSIVQQ